MGGLSYASFHCDGDGDGKENVVLQGKKMLIEIYQNNLSCNSYSKKSRFQFMVHSYFQFKKKKTREKQKKNDSSQGYRMTIFIYHKELRMVNFFSC